MGRSMCISRGVGRSRVRQKHDALGRPTVVKVGDQVLSTTTYNANGTVHRVDYAEDY